MSRKEDKHLAFIDKLKNNHGIPVDICGYDFTVGDLMQLIDEAIDEHTKTKEGKANGN